MPERILTMLIKEFIQVFRNPLMRVILFVPPIIQLTIFGFAARTDVRNVATAVCDLDNSELSRRLISQFVKSGYFDIYAHVQTQREMTELMDHNRVRIALRIDKGFSERILAGKTVSVQIILSGTDSNIAGMVLGYGAKIVSQFSEQLFTDRFVRLYGRAQPPPFINLETRTWFNDNLESRNFYIPGLIAIIVMLITLMLTGMAVVREKEIGTMEQIMVTPIRPVEFILGKTVPFALIGFFDMSLVTAVAVFGFDVPIRGSLLLLFFATGLFILSSLGVGLLISTISRTQQQAMMTMFLYFFPAILLSGFMFPIANMPPLIQWLTYINPMRYFLVIIRSIFLKGAGLDILWPQVLVLALIGTLTLALAAKRLHKTLV